MTLDTNDRTASMARFSERHGLGTTYKEITVRHDAPDEIRSVLLDISYEFGMSPHPQVMHYLRRASSATAGTRQIGSSRCACTYCRGAPEGPPPLRRNGRHCSRLRSSPRNRLGRSYR